MLQGGWEVLLEKSMVPGGGERGDVGAMLGLLDANSCLVGLVICSMNKAKLLLEVPAVVDSPR